MIWKGFIKMYMHSYNYSKNTDVRLLLFEHKRIITFSTLIKAIEQDYVERLKSIQWRLIDQYRGCMSCTESFSIFISYAIISFTINVYL